MIPPSVPQNSEPLPQGRPIGDMPYQESLFGEGGLMNYDWGGKFTQKK